MKRFLIFLLSLSIGSVCAWNHTIINYSNKPQPVTVCLVSWGCNTAIIQPGQTVTYPVGGYCLNYFTVPGAQPNTIRPGNGCAHQLLSIRADNTLNLQDSVLPFSGGQILFGAGATRFTIPGDNCQNHMMIIDKNNNVTSKSYVFNLSQFSSIGQSLISASTILNNLVNPHYANDCITSGTKQPALLDSAYAALESAFNLIDTAVPLLNNLADAQNPNNPLSSLSATAQTINSLPTLPLPNTSVAGNFNTALVKQFGLNIHIPSTFTTAAQNTINSAVQAVRDKEAKLKQIGANMLTMSKDLTTTLQTIKSNAQSLQSKRAEILSGLKTRITHLRTKINKQVPALYCGNITTEKFNLPQRMWCVGSIITAADPSVTTCMPVA